MLVRYKAQNTKYPPLTKNNNLNTKLITFFFAHIIPSIRLKIPIINKIMFKIFIFHLQNFTRNVRFFLMQFIHHIQYILYFAITTYGALIELVGCDTYQPLNYLFFLRFPTIKPAPKHTPRQIKKTPIFNTIILSPTQ